MKRRSFLKNSVLAAGAASMAVPVMSFNAASVQKSALFELRVYHISMAPNAKNRLEQYLREAFIPFLVRHEVKVGAFNEYSMEEPQKLRVLMAYPDFDTYLAVQRAMVTDEALLKASVAYNGIPAAEAVYTRYETFLMEAFDTFPTLVIPDEKKGLFELRTYESASEDAGRRKIAMFNNEEIALFLKVGLQPVFFGKIIAGEYMPALIYMVGFKDMADRDATWAKFSAHPDWSAMRVKPKYSNVVSTIKRVFLSPTDYSQF
jgi:hypothetical protein